MKRFFIYSIFLLMLFNTRFGAGQCTLKMNGDTSFSTPEAILGGGNSEAKFEILKKENQFFLSMEYDRGMSKKIELSPKTPLVFVLDSGEIVLYPVQKPLHQIENEFYTIYASAWYPITIDQMQRLKGETPKEIKLYFHKKKLTRMVQGKLIIETDPDNEQEFRQLLHFDWHYRRMIEILECALENK